jgi:hypothetical protein
MTIEAIPRLAVHLRSAFPDAHLEIKDLTLINIQFPAFANKTIEVRTRIPEKRDKDHYLAIESSLVISDESFGAVTQSDFDRLIASENLGLRGVTLTAASTRTNCRRLRVRASFFGAKGRTRDEAENLMIDILSILRYARLLEDRISRSTVGAQFCYEMYFSQYVSFAPGRQRYINYARNIFQGSKDRIFGQVASTLKNEYKYEVKLVQEGIATVSTPHSAAEFTLRIPAEVPMITCTSSVKQLALNSQKNFEIASELNKRSHSAHFESSNDGKSITCVAWKHLTNDLRFFSLDRMIQAMHDAEASLLEALPELNLDLNINAPDSVQFENVTDLNSVRRRAV